MLVGDAELGDPEEMLDTGEVADDRLGSAAVTESTSVQESTHESGSLLGWFGRQVLLHLRAVVLIPQIALHTFVHPRTPPRYRGWFVRNW